MDYRNAKTKTNSHRGNVADYISKWNSQIDVNGGTRSYEPVTVDCHNAEAPFNEQTETVISITVPKHDMTNIDKGFFTVECEAKLKMEGLNKDLNDPHHLLQCEYGWKDSNQLFYDQKVFCNGQDTGYHSDEGIREGFAYSVYKGKAEKENKRYNHTLAERVDIRSESICGGYINLADYKDGNEHTEIVTLNIPHDEFLELQRFEDFPNFATGQLEMHLKHRKEGMVWKMVDPREIKDNEIVMKGIDVDVPIKDSEVQFKRDYTQINQWADIINNATYATKTNDAQATNTYEHGKVTLRCTSLRIIKFQSNISGYGIRESEKQSIQNDLQKEPMIILSQKMFRYIFNAAVTPSGFTGTMSVPFHNTVSATVAFPKNTEDYTVYTNPMIQEIHFKIGEKEYFEEALQSIGPRFYQYQLDAGELDGPITCTKEFEDSLTMPRNDENGIRYKNTKSDTTSFLFTVRTERPGATSCFDGIEAQNTLQTRLTFRPMYTGDNDTYYIVDPDDKSVHPPYPELWLCRDCFFIAGNGFMKWDEENTPAGF